MVKQGTSASFGKEQSSEESWITVFEIIAQLVQEAGAVVPLALEAENVTKGEILNFVYYFTISSYFEHSFWSGSLGSSGGRD